MIMEIKKIIIIFCIACIGYLLFDNIFPQYKYYKVTIYQHLPKPAKVELTKEEYNALVGNTNLNSWYEKSKQVNYYAIFFTLATSILIYLVIPTNRTTKRNY